MKQERDGQARSPDPTPDVGSATDVAALGRGAEKPLHELTADEELDIADWQRVAETAEFRALVRAKRRFVVPATIFFVLYYFALPALVGYAPRLMEKQVIGVVNIAYLFALSQFFMAWILAAFYMRAASRFDRMAREIIARVSGRNG